MKKQGEPVKIKKLEVKVRRLEKIETTGLRDGVAGG